MRISFFSNFFNAHQLPIALGLSSAPSVDYSFISLCGDIDVVGRASLDDAYPFVISAYKGDECRREAMRHALEDDVVVFGDLAGQEEYIEARAKTNKPFMRYAERLLKRGDWWRFVPPKRYRTWKRFGKYKNDSIVILCSSAFTARDLSMFGFPIEKCLKWGYFPQVELHPIEARERELPWDGSLCSAQRLIPLKRVDMQVRMMAKLKEHGYGCRLTIAGDGPERQNLEELTRTLGVTDRVSFVGQLAPDKVHNLMRSHDVFLATSNRKEGWGATINEAMASGCVVVASDEMGSAPYLIKDGRNGHLFDSGSEDDFLGKVRCVLDDPKKSRELQARAVSTLAGEWGAEEAARRLVRYCEAMASGSELQFESGPLSAAFR